MQRFRALYPNDACQEIISIGFYTLRKDFDAVLKAIASLEKSVGGDPYLITLKAHLFMEKNDFAQSKKLYDIAIKEEPNLAAAHWGRITLALREKNHGETLDLLKQIVLACGIKVLDLNLLPDYDDFVKSNEHQEWVKWYSNYEKKTK
jgi:hypothetical protein